MQKRSNLLVALDIVSVAVLAIAAYLALFYAAEERVMGAVQRVFYFHIGTAWTGLMGFIVAGAAGIILLVKKDMKWDIVAVAAVEISLVFFAITIALGSIWARPTWNTWWTWDPRLTTAAITELIYIAYFMLRQGIEDPNRRARFGAVYSIIGAISAPVTFVAIRLFRTIHPVVIGSGDPGATGQFQMSGSMQVAFFFGLFAFTIIFIDLFWHRMRLGRLAARVEELRLNLFQ